MLISLCHTCKDWYAWLILLFKSILWTFQARIFGESDDFIAQARKLEAEMLAENPEEFLSPMFLSSAAKSSQIYQLQRERWHFMKKMDPFVIIPWRDNAMTTYCIFSLPFDTCHQSTIIACALLQEVEFRAHRSTAVPPFAIPAIRLVKQVRLFTPIRN